MSKATGQQRVFLFLQGPHGPFFYQLGRMLRRTEARVLRVGFNAGDRAFWFDRDSFLPFQDGIDAWRDHLAALVAENAVTDIVIYGDVRRIHAEAIEEAKTRGITVHVFEEGYMRPYWVTYERGGSNGHSRLMQLSVERMRHDLDATDIEAPLPPASWGDMRQHIFYGALYHWFVMARNAEFRRFTPHRSLPVIKEFQLYLKRLILMPVTWIDRVIATERIRRGGFPYHLALMQLEHDSSFQKHSPFSTMPEFIDLVVEGFASGAPGHHHLVFKAHPLEDGRVDNRRAIREAARRFGVEARVHYLRGGKLAQLLNDARSAVTVNSTAGQQVLWRGIPLRVFGDAVYAKPEFVSTQPLAEFFAIPKRPDMGAYKDYRRYLLETSQLPGGFYSARGRRQLLRHVVDLMLSPDDPYDALLRGTAAPRQQLRVVR